MKVPKWIRKKASLYIITSAVLPLIVGAMYSFGFNEQLIGNVIDALVGIAMVYFPSQGLSDFAEYWKTSRSEILAGRDVAPAVE